MDDHILPTMEIVCSLPPGSMLCSSSSSDLQLPLSRENSVLFMWGKIKQRFWKLLA